MGELQRVERVLLDQEHGQALVRFSWADRVEDALDHQRREAERGLSSSSIFGRDIGQ